VEEGGVGSEEPDMGIRLVGEGDGGRLGGR
jgi:hypothetical protein